MEYLRDRQIIPAFEYLINGIKLFPMHLLDSYLYWSIFVAIVGKTIANKVKIVLPNKIRIRKW
jgi:hypothetical protein